MNKYDIVLEEMQRKIDAIKLKLRQSKVFVINNTNANNAISFEKSVGGKAVSYEVEVSASGAVDISVSLDGVEICSESGVFVGGEIASSLKKQASLTVQISGAGILGAKLRIEGVDLKVM